MIRRCTELNEFEKKMIVAQPPDPAENFMIVDALYREAVALGAFAGDPLDGIETAIKIAKVINSVP